jgi:hypothetical protein
LAVANRRVLSHNNPVTPEAARQKQIEMLRAMTEEERTNLSLRLYELACEVSRWGIRNQFPDATPDEVEDLLRQRIELGNGWTDPESFDCLK